MKTKLIFTFAAIMLAINIQAQNFAESRLIEDALSKARNADKILMILIADDFCPSCARMENVVMTDEKVEGVLQDEFVTLKINSDSISGEKAFEYISIQEYPTYIFINIDKKAIIYVADGYCEVDDFYDILTEVRVHKNTKSAEEWEKEYATKKDDPEFVYNYLMYLANTGRDNDEILSSYMNTIPKEEQSSVKNIKLLYKSLRSCSSPNFDIFFSNLEEVRKLYKNRYTTKFNQILAVSRIECLTGKDEDLFRKLIQVANEVYGNYSHEFVSKLSMDFYLATNDKEKYIKSAPIYLNQYVMKLDADSVVERDYARYNNLKRKLRHKPELLDSIKHSGAKGYAGELTGAVNYFYKNAEKESDLAHAIRWAEKSVLFSESYDTYSNFALIASKLKLSDLAKKNAQLAIEAAEKENISNEDIDAEIKDLLK